MSMLETKMFYQKYQRIHNCIVGVVFEKYNEYINYNYSYKNLNTIIILALNNILTTFYRPLLRNI